MAEVIEELQKRLKAVENAIDKLREQDLLIAKEIVSAVAPMELNIAHRTMKGEEAQSFLELFSKKEEAAKKELAKTKTLESTINVLVKFDKEISDYIKATKVDTADKAMDIAHGFIKKYSPVALPLKAVRQDDIWLVDIDIGALAVKVANVKVDARTGDILSYEIPEKGSKES